MMVKLRAPSFQYVLPTGKEPFAVKSDEGFDVTTSFAKGGLANAWGGQVYEYFDSDLVDYPIKHQDLAPYYEKLHEQISITGKDDDLASFYGKGRHLSQPPLLSELGERWLKRYEGKSQKLNRSGIYIGRPRLAMHTVGENAHRYDNLEFLQSSQRSLFNPVELLNTMIDQGQVEYVPGYQVVKYEELDGATRLTVLAVKTGMLHHFSAKKVMLAAGAINSGAIALRSNKDSSTKLPVLDNPLSYIPLVDPFSLGISTQKKSYYNQLNLMYQEGLSDPVMGTFYALTGIYNSELMADLPIDLRSAVPMAKNLFPCMMVLHLWYPNRGHHTADLQLDAVGNAMLSGNGISDTTINRVESVIIAKLRLLGLLSHKSLCEFPASGNSIHYAGTLPMKNAPVGAYELHSDGRLNNTKSIYVVDGAALPTLSAKNHTLTLMANAMRIADKLVSADG